MNEKVGHEKADTLRPIEEPTSGVFTSEQVKSLTTGIHRSRAADVLGHLHSALIVVACVVF